MAVLLDTGVVFAGYDRRDKHHARARELLHAEARELMLPTPTIPEIDYLLDKHLGGAARAACLTSLGDGTFYLVDLPPAGYLRVAELYRRYADLQLGYVDAAVMTIAEHLDIGRIATFDRRHFGAVQLRVPLTLLPSG